MAYLRFKGFEEEFLRQQRPLLISEFSRVSKVPQEMVQIELLSVRHITDSPRSLEISMFQRDQGRHDAIAENLYDLLSHFGYRDVHIFFVVLMPSLYYQEGMPIGNLN
jgi:hypothetical protein